MASKSVQNLMIHENFSSPRYLFRPGHAERCASMVAFSGSSAVYAASMENFADPWTGDGCCAGTPESRRVYSDRSERSQGLRIVLRLYRRGSRVDPFAAGMPRIPKTNSRGRIVAHKYSRRKQRVAGVWSAERANDSIV